MTTPLPLLDGDTLLIDNSTMELQTTCDRAAQYGIALRRKSSADRIALRFGGIAHKCLEARYRAATPMYEQTPEVQGVMIAIAEREFSTFTVPDDEYRNLDRMVDLIDKYGKYYPYENFEIARFPDGRPFVEVPFALPLGKIRVDATFLVQVVTALPDGTYQKVGAPEERHLITINIVWMGRIDIAYRYSQGLYIMDHKTASIATNMAEFEISHQFKGYEWAVETMLGEAVSGTVINRMVCRKPTRTGESLTFERKLSTTQRGLLAEWQTDVLHIITDYLENVRRNYFPKKTSWCVGKFGTCQFHKVCSLGDTADALSDQRRMMLFSGEYEDNTWSPLKESV